jgi:hypothetical protein
MFNSERIKYGQGIASMFDTSKNIYTATVRPYYNIKYHLYDRKLEALVYRKYFNKVFYTIETDRNYKEAYGRTTHLHLILESNYSVNYKQNLSSYAGIQLQHINYIEPVKGVENIALYVCKEMNKYGDSHHNFFIN